MLVFPKLIFKMLILSFCVAVLVNCGGGSTASGNDVSGTNSSSSSTTSSSTSSSSGGSINYTDVFSGTGSVSLSWTSPTTYTNGSSLSGLTGHNIYVSNGSGYLKVDSLSNPSVSTYLVQNLSAGTYFFTVTAVDTSGIESGYSDPVTVTISS